MTIHKRIRDARLAKNLSVNAFAKKVGVSSTAAWNWDQEYTTPRPESVDKIAQILEVDANFLYTGRETKLPAPVRADTVAQILAEAKLRIAEMMGTSVDQIRIKMEVIS